MTNIIETANLTKIFGRKLIAVNNVNLEVEEGTTFGFLGPNGAGKTTTIRLLLGLIHPSAGEIRVFDEKMSANSANLRRRIGYLPTNPRIMPRMTPITYLDFVGKLFGLTKSQRTSRLSRIIRSVDLLASASREIREFSTGMITRLGLASAMMNNPDLLFLDEPTSGLDPNGRKSTLDLIEGLKEKTVFVSSHILSDIDRICSHVGIISEGKLIYSGSIKEMKKHIKASSIRLELDGDLSVFLEKARTLQGVLDIKRRGDYSLDISIEPTAPPLKIIQDLLRVVSECKLDLISVNSSSSSIEDAFLKLLEEEEGHGFLRAIEP